MNQALPTMMAAIVLGTCGLVHGLWTGRWSANSGLEVPSAKIATLSMNVGDWEGRALELDRRMIEAAEIAGYVYRGYRDRRTGREVSMLPVCGRPGPISLHEPTACYAGSGFDVSSQSQYAQRRDPGSETAEFRVAEFRKATSVIPQQLRIFWSWSEGGAWRAPVSPRVEFATARVLYKVYFISESKDGGPPGDDACVALMGAMLPELEKCLMKTW